MQLIANIIIRLPSLLQFHHFPTHQSSLLSRLGYQWLHASCPRFPKEHTTINGYKRKWHTYTMVGWLRSSSQSLILRASWAKRLLRCVPGWEFSCKSCGLALSSGGDDRLFLGVGTGADSSSPGNIARFVTLTLLQRSEQMEGYLPERVIF